MLGYYFAGTVVHSMDKNKMSGLDSDDKPNYMRWSGFGLEFGGVIALFCYAGYQLDERFSSSPWFLLSGFFLGFIGMMYLLYKEIKKFNDK